MNLKISRKSAFLIEIIGIISFSILIFIAMIFFGGGTRDDPTLPGYTFWFNTFSDLGRLVAYNGFLNITSMVLFSIAYFIIAITFIPFYLVFPDIFPEDSIEKKLTKIGSILGMISSISFIGVIFTPADIFQELHNIFAYIGYVAILFMGVAYMIAIFLDEKFSNKYGLVCLLFVFIFLTFLLMALIGSIIFNIRSYLTIGQKIGRIAIFACFPILAYGVAKE
ncbi:MAG: hypothetical protein ACTSRI_01405 [Promethearchaeota archaeon]